VFPLLFSSTGPGVFRAADVAAGKSNFVAGKHVSLLMDKVYSMGSDLGKFCREYADLGIAGDENSVSATL